ncbi:MAG: hypothetical protein O3C28_14430 [Proteobacteria bacterium]|nr:hypothetical protein [Pseudomonadota bacterium]
MATRKLRVWLDGQRDKLVWIEFDDYARKIFAGQTQDWRRIASVFVSGISQALAVIRTDVLSIDLLAPFLQQELPADLSPAERVHRLFQQQAAKEFITQTIDALAPRFGDQADIALKLPSPAQLLRRAGADDELAFDDLDDVGIGLSNLVREFSKKPISVLLVTSAKSIGTDAEHR